MNHPFFPGDIVYMIIRNPHAQDVAQVQQAAVVQHPDNHNPLELALFVHESYYPLTDEYAIFTSEEAAENAFREAFISDDEGQFYG